jgi:hypothetical protein
MRREVKPPRALRVLLEMLPQRYTPRGCDYNTKTITNAKRSAYVCAKSAIWRIKPLNPPPSEGMMSRKCASCKRVLTKGLRCGGVVTGGIKHCPFCWQCCNPAKLQAFYHSIRADAAAKSKAAACLAMPKSPPMYDPAYYWCEEHLCIHYYLMRTDSPEGCRYQARV